jgi:hypothetical protein
MSFTLLPAMIRWESKAETHNIRGWVDLRSGLVLEIKENNSKLLATPENSFYVIN